MRKPKNFEFMKNSDERESYTRDFGKKEFKNENVE